MLSDFGMCDCMQHYATLFLFLIRREHCPWFWLAGERVAKAFLTKEKLCRVWMWHGKWVPEAITQDGKLHLVTLTWCVILERKRGALKMAEDGYSERKRKWSLGGVQYQEWVVRLNLWSKKDLCSLVCPRSVTILDWEVLTHVGRNILTPRDTGFANRSTVTIFWTEKVPFLVNQRSGD